MTNNKETMSKNIDASIKNIEMYIDQLSRQLVAQCSSSEVFMGIL